MLGECSKTCGGGERTNLRDKKIRDRNGGTCSGTPTDTETCNVDFCPGIRFFFYQSVTCKMNQIHKDSSKIAYKILFYFVLSRLRMG